MRITLPYGRTGMECELPDERVTAVLQSGLDAFRPALPPERLVRKALEQPIGTPPLHKMAEGRRKVTIITSDHTRPVPSRLLMPLLLGEIRRGSRTLRSPS